MDTELFCTLLQNLLHINVAVLKNLTDDLSAFEDKYCYSRDIQAVYTRQALEAIVRSMEETIIYGLQDEIGICLRLFILDGQIFFVGPFVKAEFDAERIQRTLLGRNIPASFFPSLRLYYSAFPLLSSFLVRHTIMACIRSFSHVEDDFDYRRLEGPSDSTPVRQFDRTESLDYSSIYRRYDLENRFLRMIETGDTEHVLMAYNDMTLKGFSQNRYVNAIYQDPATGLSIVRALSRKAAEHGGASVVQIHEITQRAVQKNIGAPNFKEQNRITKEMILELTEAVHLHRLHTGIYSAPVQKTLEYLSFNFSQKLLLSTLAKRVALSESYLSKSFKKEVGMNISQYVAYLRCSQAAQILRDGNIPIQEISQYVGYEDNNYFVKVFKKQFGVTPSEYRAGKEVIAEN